MNASLSGMSPKSKRILAIAVIVIGLVVSYGGFKDAFSSTQTTPAPQQDTATQAIAQALASPVATADAHSAMPADSDKIADTLQKAAQIAAHPEDTDLALAAFAYPVSGGERSVQGYPIYMIECHEAEGQCVGAQGQPIGSFKDVADSLSPIRGKDAMDDKCISRICQDPQGNYIGAISPQMQAFWDAQHGTNQ